jgi:DOMON domain
MDIVLLLLGLMVETSAITITKTPLQQLDDPIEEITPTQIYTTNSLEENLRHRSLQSTTCTPSVYQFTASIRDDLKMSYVVTNLSISIELEYLGEAWIGLGINPSGRGKMVGSEAWIALPLVTPFPAIYEMNSKLVSGVKFDKNQTLINGTTTQENGVTTMRFQKRLNDGPNNVPVNGNGENVFVWAFGSDNTLGRHQRRGAFRLRLTPCDSKLSGEPVPVDISVECGLFSLSLFCPISFCGLFGRLIGLCNRL